MTDVRGPDGRIIRFPEGTPPAKINQVMASIYKEKPKSKRNKGTGSGLVDQTLSSVNEAVIGAVEGVYNLASGITDTLVRPFVGDKAVDEAKAGRKRTFDTLSETFVSRPSPVARTSGQIASTIPLAAVKVPAAATKAIPFLSKAAPVVTRGVQGALAGMAVRGPEDDVGRSATIGAAANVVLPPVASAMIGGGAKLARSVIPQGVREAVTGAGSRVIGALDDAGEAGYNALAPRVGRTPLPPSRSVVPPAPTASLGPEAARRAANFKAAGVREPTTAMVTRDPQAWTFEREAAKNVDEGGDLIRAFTQVADDLDRSTRKMVSARGGAGDPEAIGQAAVKALDDKQAEMQQVVGGFYKQVREARGEVPAGPLNTFRDAIDSPDMTDNPVFDQMRDGIMRRLSRFGMAGTSGQLRKDAVANVSQAEELRKFVGNLGDGKDPAVRMMRKRLIDAIDDDVVGALGDDAFKEARALAKARFDEFSKTYSGKIAQGAIAPEKLVKNVLGESTSLAQIRSLKQSLTTGTPQQIERGSQAWNGMGAQALDDLFKNSRVGDDALSGARLYKNFTKAAPKLKELLEPGEFKQLARIVQAARDSSVAPNFSSVNYSNTASALGNMFAKENPVGRATIKNVLQHIGAFFAVGPGGNVGLAVAKGVAADRAKMKAAQAMMARVQMAKSPQAAAKAVAEMEARASRDKAFAAALKRLKDFTNNMPGVFANAASPPE